MFSTQNSFASIVIVIASLFGAQSICTEFIFSQPIFDDQGGSDEPVVAVQSRNYDDPASFPTWVGIEQGVTEDGFPTLGSADAPIIIVEFSDFGCPHCLNFLPDVQTITDDYVRDGQAQLIFVPVTFVAGQNSVNAAEAAICAADQGAFWQFHQVIFEIHESQTPAGFTVGNLVDAADAIGLDGAAMEDCMQSVRPDNVLRQVEVFQNQMTIRGVPSIVYSLNGGATWTLLPDRSYGSLAALIESANGE